MSGEVLTSLLSTGLRGASGIQARPADYQPQQLLQLYDIENCPFCRLVREALTELNLDVEIYPCPKRGQRFRPLVVEQGGKAQFPYLVDRSGNTSRYESLDIIAYLYDRYAKRRLPLKWKAGLLQSMASQFASLPRIGQGVGVEPGRQPEQLLELYSFENSPYARLVREQLCAMEIPYIVRQCGRTRASDWLLPALRDRQETARSDLPNRQHLQEATGRMAIPYLYDPNTGEGLYESTDIVNYLTEQYSAQR